ncbi:MAG: 50S ribosomal protein L6 [Verrucomicrobiota bacterium]|nr:50S ribosomal protein L6 [Verrucomicrobiota bacterium]
MSRIGQKPVEIPAKVKVQVNGSDVIIEGPKGKMNFSVHRNVTVSVDGTNVLVKRASEDRAVKALHGLTRSLISNMIKGVTDGFKKELEIQGVGFKAAVQGKNLNLSLGYSHPLFKVIPDDLKVQVVENTNIIIEGVDKQKVGQFAADVRSQYPPEPYKGKGVRYKGEQVRRKDGKTVQ